MTRHRISADLERLIAVLPTGATTFMSCDVRACAFQIVAMCDELALQIVSADCADPLVVLTIREAKRLARLINQAVEQSTRTDDPRQLPLLMDEEVTA